MMMMMSIGVRTKVAAALGCALMAWAAAVPCECEYTPDAVCAQFALTGQGAACTTQLFVCEKCVCAQGGSRMCEQETVTTFGLTGADTCGMVEITFAVCPDPSPTPTPIPTASATPTPSPTPAPQSAWLVGADGDSCNAACTAAGGTCNSGQITELNSIAQTSAGYIDNFVLVNFGIVATENMCTSAASACNGLSPYITRGGAVEGGLVAVLSTFQSLASCSDSLGSTSRICCCSLDPADCAVPLP
eukprot:CAMPEP_0185853390 /NCGR_PEP_ID=MMETSP1354-20130828/18819_1 /TAXON_ID=708628 /ORGANISM="Erythrolobus madagascarensis, Strain CCMP3276" /LENGTH=245 /DNA_ID=CAMNT_0028554859 /DNA_START=291 /DNA_END=1028 /DNA_ORIENTATION=-